MAGRGRAVAPPGGGRRRPGTSRLRPSAPPSLSGRLAPSMTRPTGRNLRANNRVRSPGRVNVPRSDGFGSVSSVRIGERRVVRRRMQI